MSLVFHDDQLKRNLGTFNARMTLGITAVMSFHATRATAYARQNAPWTDRTTNARNGLNAKYVKNGKSHAIVVHHSEPYGIWLEVANSGTYAIIKPTVDSQAPLVMATLATLYSRLGGI